MLGLLLSCSRSDATNRDHAKGPGRETDPVTAAHGQPSASSAAVASADTHGTRLEGPRDQNMGRNFEGRLRARVTGLSHPVEIRYVSRGERGRLQIERPGSAAFDVILAGDQALVLDHANRRYRAHDLNTIKPRAEPSTEVQVERTSDRRELSGLLCYPWRLRSGAERVETCVRGLPGPVDADKLETLSGFDLPAWLEQLLSDQYLPIAATVTEGDRKRYELELLQYSPDEVPENELSIPANYQKL